jgi:hypothetical protein
MCNDNSLLSEDITGLVDIRSDDICNSNIQIKLLAGAAVSKNYRTVIIHGLTHKECCKTAIQVENHSPDGSFAQTNPDLKH